MDDRKFKNVSKATLSIYKFTLNGFHDHCVEAEIVDVTNVTSSTIKNHLMYCQKTKGNNATSINHKLNNIKAFFNYLETELELFTPKTNPARKLQKLKQDIRIETYTDDQIKRMLNYYRRLKYRDKSFYSYRDTAIIVTLMGTGIRLGELINLKWNDIDFKNSTIIVYGKKRMQNSIPMVVKLAKEVAEYKVFCQQSFKELPEYVFTNKQGKQLTDNAVKNIFKRLKIVMNFQVNCHKFRHHFAMSCLKQGMDVFTLQKMLRHSELSMTEKYLSLWGTALQDQANKFNPLNGLDI